MLLYERGFDVLGAVTVRIGIATQRYGGRRESNQSQTHGQISSLFFLILRRGASYTGNFAHVDWLAD
jgi:hypothetical protein